MPKIKRYFSSRFNTNKNTRILKPKFAYYYKVKINKNRSKVYRFRLTLFTVITKSDIKNIRSLKQKKFRDQYNEFIIEGTKLVQEAIEHSPEMIKTVYTSAPLSQPSANEIKYVEITNKELGQISTLKNPQPLNEYTML